MLTDIWAMRKGQFQTQFTCHCVASWIVAIVVVAAAEKGLGQQAGTLRWKVPLGMQVRSSPAIAPDGTIYAAANDPDAFRRALYSITPEGATNWTFVPGGAIFASPSIGPDGTIYLGSTDRRLYAISPAGTTNWSILTGGQILSSAAIGVDGAVYVNAISDFFNKLYSVSPGGNTNWIFSMGIVPFSGPASAQFSSPVIGPDGTIHVGSLDGKLYAVSTAGKTNWTFNLGAATYSSPAVGADGTIYVGSDNSRVYAVDSKGREKWHFTGGGYIESSAAIGADGGVYIGSLGGGLYALNSGGGLRWGRGIGGVSSSPALGDGDLIYAVPYDKTLLYALTPTNSIAWTFTLTDGAFSSPAIGADGTIYIGSGTQLFAIYGSNTLAGTAWPMFRREPFHRARALQRGITPPAILEEGSANMTLTVETDRAYRVQASADLTTWMDLTNVVSTTVNVQFSDTQASNFPRRFYRLVTP